MAPARSRHDDGWTWEGAAGLQRQGARFLTAAVIAGLGVAAIWAPSAALEDVRFRTPGATPDLADALRAASLLRDVEQTTDDIQELLATMRAEYGRLLSVLYAEGHFDGTISITADGREAATIPPLDPPADIERITVTVEPGPLYSFGEARIGPLAPATELPEGYAAGATAGTAVIRDAAEAAVAGWREAGHPKAEPGDERIVARHGVDRLDASIAIQPGPLARLGQLRFAGGDTVRPERLRAIAGWPAGRVFDPDLLARTATRLRRTGTFRSVALTEAETLDAQNRLDVTAQLVPEAPRRFGFGAEFDTVEGLTLSAYWLHRNLFRGAERLRVEGEVSGVGGSTGGTDYAVNLTFGRPATIKSDTDLYVVAGIERLNEPDYTSDTATLGAGFLRRVGDNLTLEAGTALKFSRETDDRGETDYALLTFPLGAEYDRREDPLNPVGGYYVKLDVTPFVGLNDDTGTGGRLTFDGRGYYGVGAEDRFVVAGRLQFGSIAGADLVEVPNDYRFYSGGGGTVRGQSYQSLGVMIDGADSGGASFLGASAELRAGVTEKIQLVGFYDYGMIGEEAFPGRDADSHSGAGLGLRYLTRIGPIRLDVAMPTSGKSGDDFQIYVGIGQAF